MTQVDDPIARMAKSDHLSEVPPESDPPPVLPPVDPPADLPDDPFDGTPGEMPDGMPGVVPGRMPDELPGETPDGMPAEPDGPQGALPTLVDAGGEGYAGPASVVLCAAVAARPVPDVVRLVRLLVPVLGDELHQALRIAAMVRPVEEVAELSGALGESGVPEGWAEKPGGGRPAEGPLVRVESSTEPAPGTGVEETAGARAIGGARRGRSAGRLGWCAAMAVLVAAAAEFAARWSPGSGRSVPVWSVPLGAAAVVAAWLLVRRGGSVTGWLVAAAACAVPVIGRLLGGMASPTGWAGWTAIGAESAVLLLAACALPAFGLGPVAAKRRSTEAPRPVTVTRAIDELN